MNNRSTPAESSSHSSSLIPSPPPRSVPPPVATTAILQGKAWVFGDNINTDIIIPFRFKSRTNDPYEMAKYAMYGIDPDFPTKISNGDFIVAGKNFGGGSSREQAPVALKYAGIAIVIAESFARIFYRNAFTIGLPALEISEIKGNVVQGDELKVDIGNFTVENIRTKRIFRARQVPEFMQQMLLEGGLVEYYKRNKRLPWM
ncbi:MAG: 3-isopropylmalate dehydratase small subunit [Thermoproteota archaeon]|nr:3-isopropylmalate dehydratase small subunit [Thermoproteota archaeon]